MGKAACLYSNNLLLGHLKDGDQVLQEEVSRSLRRRTCNTGDKGLGNRGETIIRIALLHILGIWLAGVLAMVAWIRVVP
jgi:hypothetical protein